VNYGAAMENGKSLYSRGVEKWVFGAEGTVFFSRHCVYFYSGRKG